VSSATDVACIADAFCAVVVPENNTAERASAAANGLSRRRVVRNENNECMMFPQSEWM
jgi:hypothetical protein